MRHRRVTATAGGPAATLPFGLPRGPIYRIAFAVVAVWAAWAFAQEAWTAHRLADQAAQVRSDNSALSAQNLAYQKDIAAAHAGGDAEEVARDSGYARPSEKVYVVSTPKPTPVTVPVRPPAVRNSSGSFWDWFGRLLHRG